ncbi:cell division protein ZipA C-terminal FtsZ-binding domain-containing protein [Taylorella equigenitalis]|uniref:Cell division protein ZipA n=1 Tax=Taylorella equigenitalis 14/56 TaxID=1091497 RepID=I7JN31_9BURK|nr:cell division protein ZipA C-terminal FtsZ-binding domain-containing protein [Taylorella equigenitalis]ASY30212.1 hypothetical protein B9Z30_02240 [Taylorella equigenitalis]ASY37515.1 hypothetical protein CA605_02165 [Taylorella equigenitalis]ASY41938.1 hypothetical protein CA943_02175 [Taylorella equigenitalis]KGK33083.1 hypothetical protein LW90_05255 [Taylorella equigenitalis]KOS58528.1 hypothetical protein AM589_06555 [Taylorella equigenitalis]
MSNMQIGILLLGAFAVLIVLVYNWWQEKKIEKRITEQFPNTSQDPLLGSDPNLGIHNTINPRSAEPSIIVSSISSSRQEHDDESIDHISEAVFDINFPNAISGSKLLNHIRDMKLVFSKPIRFFAQTHDNYHRSSIKSDESYSSLQLAVVLANRSGPLTSEEWDAAYSYADNVANAFDGSVEYKPKEQILKLAQDFDVICMELDARVGVKLILNGSQPVKAVIEIAERLGYREFGLGHVMLDDNHNVLFHLMLQGEYSAQVRSAGIEYVELIIDVPNSKPIDNPFSNLCDHAFKLAQALDARVVDDNDKPLTPNDPVIPQIDAQLLQVYQELAQNGFPAGSERARRVYH